MPLISMSDKVVETIDRTKALMIKEGFKESHNERDPYNNDAMLRILDELSTKFKKQLEEITEKELKELKSKED